MYKINKSRLIGILFCVLQIAACHHSSKQQEHDFSGETRYRTEPIPIRLHATPYVNYYLWLKGLSIDALQEEVKTQLYLRDQGDLDAKVHLILLYSLPNSPVKNPHRARKELEQYLLDNKGRKRFAWFKVFYDALVEQVNLLNRIANNTEQKVLDDELKQAEKDQLILQLDELQQENQLLQHQLTQLRKIEKAISQREQENKQISNDE